MQEVEVISRAAWRRGGEALKRALDKRRQRHKGNHCGAREGHGALALDNGQAGERGAESRGKELGWAIISLRQKCAKII